MNAATQIESMMHVLLPSGETMLPGDEVWDADFDHWELIQPANFRRLVGLKDVVRRRTFDIRPLAKDLVFQVERLREGSVPEDFWQRVDAPISEVKRRLGLKSMESYDETGLAKPTHLEGPKVGDSLSQQVRQFRQRNS